MDNKQKLIDFINTLPNDIDFFMTDKDELNSFQIKIFLEQHEDEFYKMYFNP